MNGGGIRKKKCIRYLDQITVFLTAQICLVERRTANLGRQLNLESDLADREDFLVKPERQKDID